MKYLRSICFIFLLAFNMPCLYAHNDQKKEVSFSDLPPEIIIHILSMVDLKHFHVWMRTSKVLNAFGESKEFWGVFLKPYKDTYPAVAKILLSGLGESVKPKNKFLHLHEKLKLFQKGESMPFKIGNWKTAMVQYLADNVKTSKKCDICQTVDLFRDNGVPFSQSRRWSVANYSETFNRPFPVLARMKDSQIGEVLQQMGIRTKGEFQSSPELSGCETNKTEKIQHFVIELNDYFAREGVKARVKLLDRDTLHYLINGHELWDHWTRTVSLKWNDCPRFKNLITFLLGNHSFIKSIKTTNVSLLTEESTVYNSKGVEEGAANDFVGDLEFILKLEMDDEIGDE